MDSPVIEAILLGDHHQLAEALKAGNAANVSDGANSALSLACLQERSDLVDDLLSHGATVDLRDEDGSTPLFAALGIGSAVIVEQLLKAGASTEIRNDIAQSPLMVAAHSGNLQSVRLLLSYGANPQLLDERGRSALHWALIGGDWPDVVEVLLKAKLKAESKTLDGVSVLDYANQMNRSAALELLKNPKLR